MKQYHYMVNKVGGGIYAIEETNGEVTGVYHVQSLMEATSTNLSTFPYDRADDLEWWLSKAQRGQVAQCVPAFPGNEYIGLTNN